MGSEYYWIDRLNEIRDFHRIEGTVSALMGELSEYAKFIPSFFSENGSGLQIRKLYEYVEFHKYSDITISMVNMWKASEWFSEYEQGMYDYVSNLLYIRDSGNSVPPEEIDSMVVRIQTAISAAMAAHGKFMENIFGGENNPTFNGTIQDVLSSLEILIDAIPKFDAIQRRAQRLNSITNSLQNNAYPGFKETLDSLVYFYLSAVADYYHRLIVEIVKMYTRANSAIKSRTQRNRTIGYDKPIWKAR